MQFTSVFRKPCGTLFRYSMQARTLEAEIHKARAFDGLEEFGEYLYSRPIAQVPLEMGTRYQLQLTLNARRLRYQRLDEALAGQFDYVCVGGSHNDVCVLPVNCRATVHSLGIEVGHLLHFELRGVASFKFQDLIKTHTFQAQGAYLLGYTSPDDLTPAISIPLHLHQHQPQG